jgi:ribonuclease PH
MRETASVILSPIPSRKSPARNLRSDNRQPDELRPIRITRHFTRASPGSVLIQAGGTTVLCTASIDTKLPEWMAGQGRGWLTAEYNMMPGSTSPRKRRDRDGKVDGRTTEIQRLIGRSLRAIVDLDAIGERLITLDCDVLEADGGTRTTGINGAFIALVDALATIELPNPSVRPLSTNVAAISVGLVEGKPLLDLNYREDVVAAVDMNVVMTGTGRFIEVQGSGEEATFSEDELNQLVALSRRGIDQITAIQQQSLGQLWPG